MAEVASYVFRGGTWNVDGPEQIALLVPSSSTPDQTLTVSTTSASLAALAETTSYVYISVRDASIMVRFAGSANEPTSTCGHVLTASSNHLLSATLAACARFIRQTGTNGIVFATELY